MDYVRRRDLLAYVQQHPGACTHEVSTGVLGTTKPANVKTPIRQYQYSMAYNLLGILRKEGLVYQERRGGRICWFAKTSLEYGTGVTLAVCRHLKEHPASSIPEVTKALFAAGFSPSPKRAPDVAATYSILNTLKEQAIVESSYNLAQKSVLWSLVATPSEELAVPLDNVFKEKYFSGRGKLKADAPPESKKNPPKAGPTSGRAGSTYREKEVLQFVRENPGTTSSIVGNLYHQLFKTTPAKKNTYKISTSWAAKVLTRLEKQGLVEKFKDHPTQREWFWKLSEVGTATEGRKHEEALTLLEGAAVSIVVKESLRITEKKCTVRLPGLVGMAFLLWCEKNKRDPNTVAAEVLHEFLTNTEEYNAITKHNKLDRESTTDLKSGI